MASPPSVFFGVVEIIVAAILYFKLFMIPDIIFQIFSIILILSAIIYFFEIDIH